MMRTRFGSKRSISRIVSVVAVIVVLVIVAVAGVYVLSSQKSTTTSTLQTSSETSQTVASSLSTQSSTMSATSQTSSSSTSPSAFSSISTNMSSLSSSTTTSSETASTSSSSVSIPSTLSIDDWNWPAYDLNQLYSVYGYPWPNWLEYTVYQSLFTVNSTSEYQVGGSIQYLPGLVTNWTVSPNGETYNLTLRQNVTFSDGNPFNAYQVWLEMYGFYYLSGNSSTWLSSYDLFNMTNVTFGPATIATINQTGGVTDPSGQGLQIMMNSSWPIYVTGPYQIVIQLDSPFLYLPGTLVTYDGLMFDTQYVLDNGGFGTATQFNSNFNQNPIPGSGPYVVSGVAEDNYVKFTQNPNYWGLKDLQALSYQPVFDPGQVKNVIVYYKEDDLSRYTDLSDGAAQIVAIQSADWNLVQANPNKYTYFESPPWAALLTGISFNTKTYPTNITGVRQAIVHAINISNINSQAFYGGLSPVVGPEYPLWGQFYDLGNFTPYSYNLTLAQQDLNLANINVSSLPVLNFTVPAECAFCSTIAQQVQGDLAQIGITVNIEIQSYDQYISAYGSYTQEAQNPQAIGQISILESNGQAPATLTPADPWITTVSNGSLFGNWAIYYNPTVQSCVNSFTSSLNVTYIQSLCKAAQAQIYNDAPDLWFGVDRLWDFSGSLVWQKGVINSFVMDPNFGAQNTIPVFNTITFG